RERVDARLRERRLECGVVDDVDLGGAVAAGLLREPRHAGAEDRRLRLAELHRLAEHAEAALLELALVVLEKDDRAQRSRFSCRYVTTWSAAEPSSSIVRDSPRAGEEPRPTTVVREPASPARSASTPRSASE